MAEWYFWRTQLKMPEYVYCIPVFTSLDQFEPVWSCVSISSLNQFEPVWFVWTFLNLNDPVWIFLILSDPVWTFLNMTYPAWTCPKLPEHVWNLFEPVWTWLSLCDVVWTYIYESVWALTTNLSEQYNTAIFNNNNYVCSGRVPDPTSLFLPTSFCM